MPKCSFLFTEAWAQTQQPCQVFGLHHNPTWLQVHCNMASVLSAPLHSLSQLVQCFHYKTQRLCLALIWFDCYHLFHLIILPWKVIWYEKIIFWKNIMLGWWDGSTSKSTRQWEFSFCILHKKKQDGMAHTCNPCISVAKWEVKIGGAPGSLWIGSQEYSVWQKQERLLTNKMFVFTDEVVSPSLVSRRSILSHPWNVFLFIVAWRS